MKELPLIKDAVTKLNQNLLECTHFSSFGYDNRLQIKIMLEVIEKNHSKSWINSKFLSPSELLREQPDNYLWRAACDAREWIDGEFPIEDLLFLTKPRVGEASSN